MQFKVPQFLDIEDKIFGPFTFRQFVYLAGGAGICFFFYKLLGLLFGAIPILVVAGFALMLAFYRPNNKPFINMLEAWFTYFVQDKLYIWQHKEATEKERKLQVVKSGGTPEAINGEGLSGSKLRDLAWSLDVLDLSKQKKNEQ